MVVPLPDQALTALLFGKLPAHGDFVSRGFDPATRDALDQWLAGSLAEARVGCGEAFEELYEEAPPWRFAWASGDKWAAGAMALSVDGVGRRYPILLALDGLADTQVEAAADVAENLIYDALAEGWDADRLHTAGAEAVPEETDPWEGGEGWWTLGAERFNERYLLGARPAGLMAAVLTRDEAAATDRPGQGEPDDA